MTQQERILIYLRKHHTITPQQAMQELGCMRLGARIWDLKHAGNLILTEREQAENRYGEMTTYARYRLVKEA